MLPADAEDTHRDRIDVGFQVAAMRQKVRACRAKKAGGLDCRKQQVVVELPGELADFIMPAKDHLIENHGIFVVHRREVTKVISEQEMVSGATKLTAFPG